MWAGGLPHLSGLPRQPAMGTPPPCKQALEQPTFPKEART